MPHSESQMLNDFVSGSNNLKPLALSSGVLSQPKTDFGTTKIRSTEKVLPRPPLPPKIPTKNVQTKMVKRTPLSQSSNSFRDLLSPLDASLKLPISRSSTPSDFHSISRNSSYRSIDNFNGRSISPSVSLISHTSSLSSYHDSRKPLRSLTPRRIFPQTYLPSTTIDLNELKSLDNASTVFDGKLSFVLGCQKQRVRQVFRPSPAHSSEADTASRYLSEKINNFLKRTDHVMEEWNGHCKSSSSSRHCNVIDMIEDQRNGDEINTRLGRSKSVTNIMIKGYQMAKNMPPTVRSNSVCRVLSRNSMLTNGARDDDEDTIIDDEVKSKIFF